MKNILLILILLASINDYAQQSEKSIHGIEGFYNSNVPEGKQRIKDYLLWRISRDGELTKSESDKIFEPKNAVEFEELKKSIERFENTELMTANEVRHLLEESKYRGYLDDNMFERGESKEPKYVFPEEKEPKKIKSKTIIESKEDVYFYIALGIIFITALVLILRKKIFNKI